MLHVKVVYHQTFVLSHGVCWDRYFTSSRGNLAIETNRNQPTSFFCFFLRVRVWVRIRSYLTRSGSRLKSDWGTKVGKLRGVLGHASSENFEVVEPL